MSHSVTCMKDRLIKRSLICGHLMSPGTISAANRWPALKHDHTLLNYSGTLIMSSEIYFPKSLLTYCFKYFIDSGKDVRLCSLFSATRDGWLSSTSNTGWWSSCMLLECGQCGLDTRRKTLGTEKMGSGHKEENVRSRDNQSQTMLQNEW